ncbi:MAG: PHP domain-containing protein [Candidatus Aenigmarchaeota archaeon]|nr:PHP domain-containing protein [Candidatus Aenigmarchaeota archaeon]
MKFFDLHVHSAFSGGTSSLEQLASTAKELGYTGICFAEYFQNENQLKKLKEEIAKASRNVAIEIYLGFEARSPNELHRLVERRKMFDILLVQGGNLKMNRLACETPEVDILTHPENNRNDSGLNQVLLKSAAKNNVAIEVNFREILLASKRTRNSIIRHVSNNVRLAKKFHAPIILCSGGISHFELRDPQIMMSMANQLGLKPNETKDAISRIPENIIKQIKEKKSEKWIMPGVRIRWNNIKN